MKKKIIKVSKGAKIRNQETYPKLTQNDAVNIDRS